MKKHDINIPGSQEETTSAMNAVDADANDAVAQLVRKAGRRAAPSAAATQQAYNVVRAAWTFEQRGRAKMHYAALAAGLTAVVAIGLWMWRPQTDASPIAHIAQLHGEVMQLHSAHESSVAIKGAVIVGGDELYSASNGRVVLQRISGLNIVLGANTRVRWTSHDDLRLIAGVIYVDTGMNAANDPFKVATEAGIIQHVGTQFTVISRSGEVRVAVRQGSVRLQSHDRVATVVHGEQAVLLNSGELLRDQVSETNGAWNWLSSETAQFAIDERSVFDVLADIADASGVRVNYASAETEAQAKQLKLHGPALELEPNAAINAVLLTTQLTADRTPQALLIKSN